MGKKHEQEIQIHTHTQKCKNGPCTKNLKLFHLQIGKNLEVCQL